MRWGRGAVEEGCAVRWCEAGKGCAVRWGVVGKGCTGVCCEVG